MYQNGTGEHLGNNAKGSASNLVCLFKIYIYVAISDKVLGLKENRMLFARIAANCRPDMHLQECLSNYELYIMPRSLFAADDTLLYCSDKSKLMDILEKMSSTETSDEAPPDIPQPNRCVAIIHTMADVHSMYISSWITIKICQLILFHLYKENVINYIFCLTGMTFQNHISQQQGICSLVILTLWHNHITDTTNISNAPSKKL